MALLPERLTSPVRILAVLLVLAVIAWLAAGIYVETVRRAQAERLARTEAVADSLIAQTKAAFREVELIRSGELGALRTYQNAAHVERARTLGIAALEDRDAAELLTGSDVLVELESTPYYVVQEFTHSIPFVTRSTARLLALIGMRFQAALAEAGLPPYRYVVTSATRTLEDQRRLRRSNANAALTSSHFFGTTLDLHYQLFDYLPTPPPVPDSLDLARDVLQEHLDGAYAELALTRQQKLKALLGRTLLQLQTEGKVLVIYERLQPVYHITLGERLAPPARQPALQADSRSAAPASPPEVGADGAGGAR